MQIRMDLAEMKRERMMKKKRRVIPAKRKTKIGDSE
jgi:hypothetical protein